MGTSTLSSKVLIDKSRSLLIISAILIGAFLPVHLIHFKYLEVDVILYAALKDVGFSLLISLPFLYFFRAHIVLSKLEQTLILACFLLGGYVYAITIPTVIDRSLSIYILEKINQHDGSVNVDSIESIYHDYIDDHRLVDVRLTEQLKSGTIKLEKRCVMLTERGYFIVKFTNFYRSHFLPEKRLLMGEYTDALKNPIGNRKDNEHYSCG